jgi:autotransporter-associated beta strand protein
MRARMQGWSGAVCMATWMAAAWCGQPVAFGQATWNGSQSGSWATLSNWSGTSAANLVNSGTTGLVFAGGVQLSTTNTLSNFLASSLTFDSTAGNFTLSGSSIRLSGNLANNAAASSQTIDLGINITASARQFSGVSTSTTTYVGNMTGVGGMSYRTTSGSTSVHVISGSNSYTANTSIATAIVVVNSLKALSSGTIDFGSGTLRSNLDLTGANKLTNAAVTFTSANNRANFAGPNSMEFAAALRSNSNSTVGNELDAGKTLTFNGVVAAGVATTGTVTFTGAGRSVISGNAVDGAGVALALAKTGGGALVLAGTNSYSGVTTVTAGSLFVNGNAAGALGALTVSSTAILAGAGSIGGATTVSGTLTPGADAATIGLFTFANSLTLNASSRTLLEISGTDRGVGYDAIDVASVGFGGVLDLSFGSLVTGTFNLFNGGGALAKTGSFSSVTSSGAYATTWGRTGEMWSATVGATNLSFDQTNGTLVIVPEPGAVALVGMGLGMWAWRQRRRIMARGRA